MQPQKLLQVFYLLYYLVFKMLLRFPFPQRRIRYLHELLNTYVKSAGFSFTCGSTSGYFIRKFLEIPLLDFALISFEYSFISRLGFQADRDYLALMPSEVGVNSVSDLILGISNEVRDCLVENAKTQILLRHSLSARVKQLTMVLDKLTSDQFFGSEWIDGSFVVKGYDDKSTR